MSQSNTAASTLPDNHVYVHEQLARNHLLQLEAFSLDPQQTLALMDQLMEATPQAATTLLCLLFDVACYRVNHLGHEPAAAEHEQNMYFASVPVDSDLAERIREVSLGQTRPEAEANAVKHLGLLDLFRKDQQAKAQKLGHTL